MRFASCPGALRYAGQIEGIAMLYTTLNLLRANGAHPERFSELANYGPDEPIPLTRILKIVGLDDTLRTLPVTTTPDEAARFAASLACDYAEHLLPAYERVNPDDDCLRHALETTRRFLRGDATQNDVMELLDGVYRAANGADIDAECDDEGGQFFWASDAADVIANVIAIAAESADYCTNVRYLVEDLPESEREWQARHLAEMLEKD
jgi:hypothetical protein